MELRVKDYMYLVASITKNFRSFHIILHSGSMTTPPKSSSPCSTCSSSSDYGLRETPEKYPSDHPDPDWPNLEDLPITIPPEFSDGTVMWTDKWIDLRARGRAEIDELLTKGQTNACAEIPEKYDSPTSPDSPCPTNLAEGASPTMAVNSSSPPASSSTPTSSGTHDIGTTAC